MTKDEIIVTLKAWYLNLLEPNEAKKFDKAFRMAVKMIEEDKNKDWRLTKDELPPTYADVLAYDGADYFVAWYDNKKTEWHSHDRKFEALAPIIAWKPIELYEGVENAENMDKDD